jgi:hypothetical protein
MVEAFLRGRQAVSARTLRPTGAPSVRIPYSTLFAMLFFHQVLVRGLDYESAWRRAAAAMKSRLFVLQPRGATISN